jgi:peptide/nickel transport system permease protein
MILPRLLQAIPLLFIIVGLNFVILHLSPGDPAIILAGPQAPPEHIDALRKELGLDKPLIEQLTLYFKRILVGDLGYSYTYRRPVISVIGERLVWTLMLTIVAFILSLVLGVALGVVSSRYAGWGNQLAQVAALIGYSVPEFWLGMICILVFGLYLRMFPTQGVVTPGLTGLNYAIDVLRHLLLPALVLAANRIALYSRLTRASMLEVLQENYIVTAKSKGLDEFTILYKHALRNALLPIITVIGIQFRLFFTGAVLVETVFAWPGIGRLTFDSIGSRDYGILMAIFLVVSFLVVLGNLIADFAYAYADPRVRYN